MSVKTVEQVRADPDLVGEMKGTDTHSIAVSFSCLCLFLCPPPLQAERAIQDGADYLGCGACFATGTKDTAVIGLEGLEAVCR